MHKISLTALLMTGVLVAAPALAQTHEPTPSGHSYATPSVAAPAKPAAPKVVGYLGKDGIPNAIEILPPPPPKGSTLAKLDNETYLSMIKTKDSARWALATRDASHYFAAFDCVLGVSLEGSDVPPSLITFFRRVGADASATTNLAKDHFNVPRPFIASGGPVCTEDQRAGLMKSYGYPSGHTTFSWALGLILAEMAPDKASDILARARAFGESRVVCGVHEVSDIEEGRTNGAALVAVLHSNPAFKADLEAAKKTLADWRASAHATPDAGQCKVDAEAMIHTPWINPDGGPK